MTPRLAHTSITPTGEAIVRMIVPGVRKMPTPTTCPATRATVAGSPSSRASFIHPPARGNQSLHASVKLPQVRSPASQRQSLEQVSLMFIGHIAVGLAGKRMAPSVSLATWLTSVQLVDMLWPIFLLADLEHVRIAPGVTRFTPLDFYDYPITHSLVGSACWAALFAGGCMIVYRNARVA